MRVHLFRLLVTIPYGFPTPYLDKLNLNFNIQHEGKAPTQTPTPAPSYGDYDRTHGNGNNGNANGIGNIGNNNIIISMTNAGYGVQSILEYLVHLLQSRQLNATDDKCVTNRGEKCIFPFIYARTKYYGCTSIDDDAPWCATRLDSSRRKMDTWGNCASNCKLHSAEITTTTTTNITTTTTTATTTQGCLKEDNVDYYGNDIDNKKTGRLHECVNWCGEIKECKFWALRKSDNWCWRKTSDSDKRNNNDVISGTKSCATENTKGWCADINGNKINKKRLIFIRHTKTAQKCLELCKKQIGVTGCQYRIKNKKKCKYLTIPLKGASGIGKSFKCWKIAGCNQSCTNFMSRRGFGQCKKVSKKIKGPICYVQSTSTCSDKLPSTSDPGKFYSATACKKKAPAGQPTPGQLQLQPKQPQPQPAPRQLPPGDPVMPKTIEMTHEETPLRAGNKGQVTQRSSCSFKNLVEGCSKWRKWCDNDNYWMQINCEKECKC